MSEIYRGQPKAPPPAKMLLDVKEAADVLSVSQRTVHTLKDSGQLKCVRIQRRVLFPVAELESYIQRQLTN